MTTTDTAPKDSIWKSELEDEVRRHETTRAELEAVKGQMTDMLTSRDRFLGGFQLPTRMTSVVDLIDGRPLVVGWDTCGKCIHHVSICECPTGPTAPSYIEKFRREGAIPEYFGLETTALELATSGSTPAQVPADGVPSAPATATAGGVTCATCHKPVTIGVNADADDDGGALCFECQEAS